MVLAAEVRGRWSEETAQFLRALVKASAQEAPRQEQRVGLQRGKGQAGNPGTGANTPLVHEMENNDRFA